MELPTGPEGVLRHIEEWERRREGSRFTKVGDTIRAGSTRIQRFSACIDKLAGANSAASLLWGSIKFVLTLVDASAEEHAKLCQGFAVMVNCLPRIEVYADIFDSPLVHNSVNAFYNSMLRFWIRACKYYRGRRHWRLFRVAWNDCASKLQELEQEMTENRDRVEKAALAEHIGEAKKSRVEQKHVNRELIEAQEFSRQKDINSWLAPQSYDTDYYVQDLMSAKKSLHPGTCKWVLKRKEFEIWAKGDDSRGSFLWISARPGAGKTVLFVLDRPRLLRRSIKRLWSSTLLLLQGRRY